MQQNLNLFQAFLVKLLLTLHEYNNACCLSLLLLFILLLRGGVKIASFLYIQYMIYKCISTKCYSYNTYASFNFYTTFWSLTTFISSKCLF